MIKATKVDGVYSADPVHVSRMPGILPHTEL
jgi:uridylate kinase